jgi:pSer/pThr/pTyr-binding forkhead associated (FHA) protein
MRMSPESAAGAERAEALGASESPAPVEAPNPALARILLASGGRTIAERALRPGRLIIGRTGANDLQVESRFVSRHHCQIVTSQNSCVIEDLNSTNGIFLHSKRVRYHNLNDGDVITIGQHELLYIDERSLQRGPPSDQHHPSADDGAERM